MITDATGRKLKPGQLVRIPVSGMFTGVIQEIHENAIIMPGQQGTIPARVVIALMPVEEVVLKNPDNPSDGLVRDVYIVRDAPPQTKADKEHEEAERRAKMGIVH